MFWGNVGSIHPPSNEYMETNTINLSDFDMLDVGVSITDKMGNIVDCNKASEKILGLTKEQCLSRNNTENEWKVIRPDLSIMPPEEFASVRAMKEKRAISNVEMGTGLINFTVPVDATPGITRMRVREAWNIIGVSGFHSILP